VRAHTQAVFRGRHSRQRGNDCPAGRRGESNIWCAGLTLALREAREQVKARAPRPGRSPPTKSSWSPGTPAASCR